MFLLAASFTLVAEAATCPAEVRVINASPDSGSFDVLINGKKTITDLKFPTAAGYTQFDAGSIKVQVNAAGKDTAAIAPVDVNLVSSGRVTIVAAGLVAGAGQSRASTLSLQVLQDDGALPTAGKAKVRVIQASPDAGAVDVFVGAQKVATNVDVNKASPFVEVTAGSFPVKVTATGKTDALFAPVNQ
ncbi:MAG: DUF4397 domain-containing protein, partial [Fimbriimonas ginsengisoli]|nr:DUF4397 domain-containing protein [Fimbriimonas ginsengisoli]